MNDLVPKIEISTNITLIWAWQVGMVDASCNVFAPPQPPLSHQEHSAASNALNDERYIEYLRSLFLCPLWCCHCQKSDQQSAEKISYNEFWKACMKDNISYGPEAVLFLSGILSGWPNNAIINFDGLACDESEYWNLTFKNSFRW